MPMSKWGRLFRDFLVISVTVLLLLELVLQCASYFFERPLAALNSTARHPRVLCLGDSHTYGLFLERQQAWPSILEEALHKRGVVNAEVINLAYPGTNSYRVKHSIESMLEEIKPDIVILMLGANDYWTSPLDAAEKTEGKVENFLKKYVRIYKLLMFAVKTEEVKTGRYFLEDTLRNLHQDEEGQAVANLRKVLSFFKIETQQEENGEWYAVWRDERLSFGEILSELRQKNSGEMPSVDFQKITDTGFLNLGYLKNILKEKLGVSAQKIESEGDLVGYGSNAYRLGATFNSEGSPVKGKQASESLADNLRFITNVVQDHQAQPILMTYHFQVKYVYANDVIRAVAAEHQIHLVDLHKAILPICRPFSCRQLLFSDLHPNAQGQIFIAETVDKFLQENMSLMNDAQ